MKFHLLIYCKWGYPLVKEVKFSWYAIERIQDFILNCSTLSNIELDGGLTFNIVKELKKEPINRLAGWSIISDENPKKFYQKLMR